MQTKSLCAYFLGMSLVVMAVLFSSPASLFCATSPEKGAELPAFQLTSPAVEEDLGYLGVKNPAFQLKDVECQVLLVEIIGVYCPRCYQQAPIFNKLFSRLQKKGLSDRVKMLAVAAGGTAPEVEHLRTSGSYEFPVVPDESYTVHKLLGEPRTPFTMLVERNGRVLFTHLGIIEDIDPLLQQIENLVK